MLVDGVTERVSLVLGYIIMVHTQARQHCETAPGHQRHSTAMALELTRLPGCIRIAQPRDLNVVTSLYMEQATQIPEIAWCYPYWDRSEACFDAFHAFVYNDFLTRVQGHGGPNNNRWLAVYEDQFGRVTGFVAWNVRHRVLRGARAPAPGFSVGVSRGDMARIRGQARQNAWALAGRDGVYYDEFRSNVMELYHERAAREMLGRRGANGAQNGVVTVELVCVAQERKRAGIGAELVAFVVGGTRRSGYYVMTEVSDTGIHGWLQKLGFSQLSAASAMEPDRHDQVDRREAFVIAVWGLLPWQNVRVKSGGVWQDQPDSERAAAY
ncbi:hypothetical protein RB593_001221 [Gaeumannomyces tritici]